ncbi:TonB-dependent receptor [Taibaiella chishuiensis]|uniref:Outer membrane receptor protein involved in Fe transport n=1 Tax=Taibaiella chishuiensis TaxID=1434707 RepID=A0A2P8D2W1_9BACT|nr:TonB-dependent receptor [Taibaiella chishuiensis]PSK91567.1 outer membrane receptor protein involved in Fe transport [Taibaiella chishuiensis]
MKSWIILLISCITLPVCAQPFTITGKVTGVRGMPLPFCSIVLEQKAGRVLKGTLTDSSGSFSLDGVAAGSYRVTVSLVGYRSVSTDVFEVKDADYRLPDLELIRLGEQLADVQVTARMPLLEVQPDKMVMDIEHNVLATGSSAWELLRKAPSVTTGKDDNILLKGAGCTIYIDGRPVYLAGDQLVQYLKGLPADAISKIEIITNPSSRYDAAGSTGIINIKLKKNKAYGTNGTLNASLGRGRYFRQNGGFSLNYRNSKINLFGNGYLGHSESFNQLNYNSIVRNDTNIVYQDRSRYWHPFATNASFKAGLNYALSSKTTAGLLINGYVDRSKATNDGHTTLSDKNKQPYQFIDALTSDSSRSENIMYNLNFQTLLDTVGSELNIDLDYGHYNSRETSRNDNLFFDRGGNAIRDPYIFRTGKPSRVTIRSGKLDFTRYFSKQLKLEAGMKSSWVTTDNNLLADSTGDKGAWIPDRNRSNHFIYKENINAAYATATYSLEKTAIQIGLRVEQTISTGNSITTGQVQERHYLDWFPGLFITRTIDTRNQVSFSYTRRINRPGYESLNPFTDYIDPYTLFVGNPFLRSSYSNALELKHAWKEILFTALSYRMDTDVETEVIRQDQQTGITTNTKENAASARALRLDITLSLPVTSWWQSDNNANIAFNKNYSAIPGFAYNQEAMAASFSTNHTFTFGKYKIQTDIYYGMPTRNGLARLRCYYGWNLGIQRLLLKDRLTLKVNATNIIGPNAYRAHITGNGLDIKWTNEWEGRRVYFSLAWKFGNSNVKEGRVRNTASQEEKNRITR